MLTKSKSSKDIIELEKNVHVCIFQHTQVWESDALAAGSGNNYHKGMEDMGYLFSAHSDCTSWSVVSY